MSALPCCRQPRIEVTDNPDISGAQESLSRRSGLLNPSHFSADSLRWLEPRDPERPPVDLIRPFDSDKMKVWRVDKRINNVKNNDAALSEPVLGCLASKLCRVPHIPILGTWDPSTPLLRVPTATVSLPKGPDFRLSHQ